MTVVNISKHRDLLSKQTDPTLPSIICQNLFGSSEFDPENFSRNNLVPGAETNADTGGVNGENHPYSA
jgi:hypothetical protein